MNTLYEVTTIGYDGHSYKTFDKEEAYAVKAWYEENFPAEGEVYRASGRIPNEWVVRESLQINPLTDKFNLLVHQGIGRDEPRVVVTDKPVMEEVGSWSSTEATYPMMVVAGIMNRDEARQAFEDALPAYHDKLEEQYKEKRAKIDAMCDEWIDDNLDVLDQFSAFLEARQVFLSTPDPTEDDWDAEESEELIEAGNKMDELYEPLKQRILDAPLDCYYNDLYDRVEKRFYESMGK